MNVKYIFILFISFFIISCNDNDTPNICEPNPCADSPVAHKVVCEPIGDKDFTCICEAGFELNNGVCQLKAIDYCNPNPCAGSLIAHKTICEASSDDFKCVCEENYHLDGQECIETVDPCKINPCTEENKTKCIANSQTDGDYTCQCDSDYELINDICKPIPLSEACSMPRYKEIFDNDLRDLALINKLHIITGENYYSLGYDSAKNELYHNIDNDNGDNQCVYTGRWHTAGSGVNCEHTWPQSQLERREPMKSDLHHLYSTESRVNSSRGHLRFANIADHVDDYKDYDDYGQCKTDEPDYYCSKRLLNGGDDGIFEPADQHKGNVARAIFYFAVRWGNMSGEINDVVAPFINQDMKMALKAWNKLDRVDDKERLRNDKIEGWIFYEDGTKTFSRLQGNRNPFIDCPELLDRIDLEHIKFPEAY